MSLRLKLVLALVALSTAATAAIGLFSYRTTAHQLEAAGRPVARRAPPSDWRERPERTPPGGVGTATSPTSDGASAARPTWWSSCSAPTARPGSYAGESLPVDDIDVRIAGRRARAERDPRRDRRRRARYRMLTAGYGNGMGAVQTARSLAENERVLAGLRSSILVAAVVVILRRGGRSARSSPGRSPVDWSA